MNKHFTDTILQIWNNWHVSTTDEDIKDYSSTSAVHALHQENLNFFFPSDNRTFSREAVGRDRTNQVMDSSTHLISIIQNECNGDADEIVGEIQFCYLMGMILGNISCLMHWQHVVKIIFKAPQLTLDNPTFFQKFIDTIRTQLTYDNVGIDGSIFDHDNELHRVLRPIIAKFKARFEELYKSQDSLTDDQKGFQDAFKKFEEFMKTFEGGWDLSLDYLRVGRWQLEDGEFVEAELSEFQDEDERGEYAPAVVELDEDGRESGLIRF